MKFGHADIALSHGISHKKKKNSQIEAIANVLKDSYIVGTQEEDWSGRVAGPVALTEQTS